jgi:hypothetical protein
VGKPDGEQILNDALGAFQESVGREPDTQEVVEIARVVAQEIKDQYDAE